jgi:mono/diheme cytochrome c family protein
MSRRYRRPAVPSAIRIWKTRTVLRPLVFGLVLSVAACGSTSSAEVERIDTSDGGALYLRTCGGCHGAKGTPQQEASLPSLDDYSADELRLRILHGGEQMPTFAAALSDAELDSIVDYLLDS